MENATRVAPSRGAVAIKRTDSNGPLWPPMPGRHGSDIDIWLRRRRSAFMAAARRSLSWAPTRASAHRSGARRDVSAVCATASASLAHGLIILSARPVGELVGQRRITYEAHARDHKSRRGLIFHVGEPSGVGSVSTRVAIGVPFPGRVITGPSGAPHAVITGDRRRRVLRILDRWITKDRWWTETPIERRYFQVQVEPGRQLLLYVESPSGVWHHRR